MIKGIGIDAVEINRFESWKQFSKERLSRFYSKSELDYIFQDESKICERLAARFALREAFYKALCNAHQKSFSFLKVCRALSLTVKKGIPQLIVDWCLLNLSPLHVHVSLTHTCDTAMAFVILSTADTL